MKAPQFSGDKDYRHEDRQAVGVLLVNLGTPDAPTAKALRPYLKEFLWDPRVIELPRALWWLILHGSVLRTRPKESAALYKSIWTDSGSPLRIYTENVTRLVQERLDEEYSTPIAVEYGMRYGRPSIASALQRLREKNARRILLFPLYPQYSATSSGTAYDAAALELTRWRWVPELRTIMQFHDHPGYIDALVRSVEEVWEKDGRPEKLVMSFHGIPKRYFTEGDPYYCHCQKTGRLLAQRLGLSEDQYLVTFQSLFGKEEWIRPYTDETMRALGESGVKSIDVICPGFTADCLETLEEIDVENREIFLEAGGEKFRYIPALNDRDYFIDVLCDLVRTNLAGWAEVQNTENDRSAADNSAQTDRLHQELKARSRVCAG